MRSVYYPHLVNGAFGDPALYVRLAHRGEALLFDCGDLHPLTTRETLKIRGVFISHAHIDHLVGFDHLLRNFLYQNAHLRLYGPAGIIDRIAGRLSGYTWNLTGGYPLALTVFEWRPDEGRQVTFRADNGFRPEMEKAWPVRNGLLVDTVAYRVRASELSHGDIVSLAFALEEPLHVAIHKNALERFGYQPGPWLTRFKDLVRRQAPEDSMLDVPLVEGGKAECSLGSLRQEIAHLERGMKICYVTDADPSPKNLARIIALAADSHLLAIEATFAHRELERARQRGHLTARLAGESAREAKAARLLVFHHSPRYLDRPDELAEEARRAFFS